MEEDSMARSAKPQSDQSLGELVAQAAKDISQLIHYEIDLAKSELKFDVRRLVIAALLGGFCALAGCLVVIMLCFGYAYLLHSAGAPGGLGGAFGFTALTIAGCAALVRPSRTTSACCAAAAVPGRPPTPSPPLPPPPSPPLRRPNFPG
jgi:hypothetical protein